MAFTVAKYGIGTLTSFAQLTVCLYLTSFVFIVVVLGAVMRECGLSLWKFVRYIKNEVFITLGTASTEAVLPQMLVKMERMGCAKPVVGMVLPTGYAFNADGTAIYLTMASLFVAQAMNINLTIWDQLVLLGVLLSYVQRLRRRCWCRLYCTRSNAGVNEQDPRLRTGSFAGRRPFLNEARAVTNLIGNGVATIAVARWEREIDMGRARAVLNGEVDTNSIDFLEEDEQAQTSAPGLRFPNLLIDNPSAHRQRRAAGGDRARATILVAGLVLLLGVDRSFN